jgi:hypothetical protein
MADPDTASDLYGDCFFITPLGPDGSEIRNRADELQSIISEVLDGHGLTVMRADNIGEPGMITQQIVRAILRSRMVFADLTGANANVYYELGVAHSLSRPLVTMIDKARDLTFDTAHDRAIIIGDEGVITLSQARQVKAQLQSFVTSVLSGQYRVRNVVTEAGSLATVDSLSPGDPVISMLSRTHDDIAQIRKVLEVIDRSGPDSKASDSQLMRQFIERLMYDSPVPAARLRNALLDGRTSADHDEWLERLVARLRDSPGPLQEHHDDIGGHPPR